MKYIASDRESGRENIEGLISKSCVLLPSLIQFISRLWAQEVYDWATTLLESGQLDEALNHRLVQDGADKTAGAKRKAAASLRRVSTHTVFVATHTQR
jgi:hypothetical protein